MFKPTVKTTLRALPIVALAAISTAAFAQSVTVHQKGQVFSEQSVTVKAGEDIKFINDDNVAHNVYVLVNGSKKDLGLQKPGEEGDLTITETGSFRVRCAIHPKMKMNVIVE